MGQTLLYLIRHGEQDRASGHSPTGGLSDLGREQAELLGLRLRGVPFSALRHSPLPRAVQTAEVLASHLPGVPVAVSTLLIDRTPVPAPGREDEYPAEYRAFLSGVPAEERDEGGLRIQAAIDHFGVIEAEDRHELLVTHNFVIGWFVRHALDAPVWRWIGLNQANCGLTIVRWQTGRPPALVCFNDVGHLDPALRR